MSFISTISKAVPERRTIFDSYRIPFACTVTPHIEIELPKVQFPRFGIVRCLCCKGYISLFCHLEPEAKRWKCGMCEYENSFGEEYLQVFHSNRTEITSFNYEIYAEEPNMERPPMCPCYFLCLDFSLESVKTGYLSLICDSILSFVDEKIGQNEVRTLFGIILYSRDVSYVQISPSVRIISISDPMSELWLPVPVENLLVDFHENIDLIKLALSHIKSLSSDLPSTAFKKALIASQLVLKPNGGKLLAFICNSQLEAGHPKSFKITPTTDFYHDLCEDLVENQISCDVFLAGNSYCGLFTYAELAKSTGGSVYYYKNFTPSQYQENLLSDLYRIFIKPKAWEAGLRLRISDCWKITSQQGHFLLKRDLLQVPFLQNSSYTFDMRPKYETSIQSYLTFQAALLYTSSEGIRIIRIINYQVPIDNSLENFLISINSDTLVNLLMKHAVVLIIRRSILLAGQKFLETKALDIMKTCLIVFRVLPDNLVDFFKKIQGLMKHSLFVNTLLPCKSN